MKRFLTKQKILMILVPIFGIVAILAILTIDDPLSDKSKRLLEKTGAWQGNSDAYLYLLGWHAPLGKEPIEEGRIILKQLRVLEEKYGSGDILELPTRETLNLREDKIACTLTKKKCRDEVFSNAKIRLDDENLSELRLRYLHFLEMDDFQDLTMPHTLSVVLEHNLIFANKLVLLDAIQLAKNNPEKATKDLMHLIDGLKKYAVKVGGLVDKVIIYVALNITLDVLFMLSRNPKMAGKGIAISPLSQAELSFEKLFVREFSESERFFKMLLHGGGESMGGNAMTLNRFLFKVNMVLNRMAIVFTNTIERSECSQENYLALRKKHEEIKEQKSWIRNPTGTLISDMARPSYGKFIEMGFNFNAKIALFNGLLGKSLTPENVSKIKNPYFTSGNHAQIKGDSGVCFSSEETDEVCLTFD